jgi:DNA-damage-inducible protein J
MQPNNLGGFMSAKVQTSLRLDAEKFTEAKQILAHLGMNFSEAVNIFTSQVVAQRGLPFQVVLPNEETKAAMLDVRAGKNLDTVSFEQFQQEVTLR